MLAGFRIAVTALSLGALSLLTLSACGKQQTPEAPRASVDVNQTLEMAKQSIEKIRLTMRASKETRIEVVGAEPSEVPGLVDLKLRVSLEGRTAVRTLPVTPDLTYAIRGVIVRLGQIPRPRVDLMNVDLEDAPTRGKADAPLTLVEYSDFQCPYCVAVQPMLERILREYEGKVKLVFKHHPLRMHAWAMDSALLSECARKQKPALFWKLHDYYFESGNKISRDNILELTQEALKEDGIDVQALTKCYLDRETLERVRKNMDEGKSIGVVGTPFFLVNDVVVSGATPFEVFNAVILEELGKGQPEEGGA